MRFIAGSRDTDNAPTSVVDADAASNDACDAEDARSQQLLRTAILTAGMTSALCRLFEHHALPLPTALLPASEDAK
jgi:hypothetical protein